MGFLKSTLVIAALCLTACGSQMNFNDAVKDPSSLVGSGSFDSNDLPPDQSGSLPDESGSLPDGTSSTGEDEGVGSPDPNTAVTDADTTDTPYDSEDVADEVTTCSHGGYKVQICHRTGNGGSHTLRVNSHAFNAHIRHGDYLGACQQ